MKYLFLLHSTTDAPEHGTAEAAQAYADYSAALQVMAQAGVLIDCAPLTPASSATTVRVREGETLLTDGPADELTPGLRHDPAGAIAADPRAGRCRGCATGAPSTPGRRD